MPTPPNGRTFLTNTGKANAFVLQYAAVSRLSFDKTERAQARHLKKALQLPTAAESCCSPFTIPELDIAIHVMRRKGAVCPDDFLPTFLKALGPTANRQELSPPTDLSASHPVLSRQWREWCTTVYTT